MKSLLFSLGCLFILITFYVNGCRRAGSWLVKRNEPVHADAMFIFMGSIVDRALQAADLYKSGMAEKVIIVEFNSGAYKELEARGIFLINGMEQMRNTLVGLDIPIDSIVILPGDAQSTQQEALIIREYLADKPDIDTLLLVTSSLHTRRASMIFKCVLRKSKTPVCVFCSPSAYTDFNDEKWWKSKESIEGVLLEYLKIANFVLFDKRELREKCVP